MEFLIRREVKEGDIVSVDCGVKMNGYFGDAAFTFAVGEISPGGDGLIGDHPGMPGSRYCNKLVAGNRIGDIGYAVQQHAEVDHGYGVIREMVGHGIGKKLHEPPEVPNYGKRGKGPDSS